MQSPLDKLNRYLSDFRTSKRSYQLAVTEYTCNKFGLAELFALHFDSSLLPSKATVLDVGSGVGPISIFLADQFGYDITAVEINPIAHKCCIENIKKYNLEHKIIPLNLDFSSAFQAFPTSSYDLIVANPPIGISPHRSASCNYYTAPENTINAQTFAFLTNSWTDPKGLDLVDHILRFSKCRLNRAGHIVLACCSVDLDCVSYMNAKLDGHDISLEKRIDSIISPESIGVKNMTDSSIDGAIFILKKTNEGALR